MLGIAIRIEYIGEVLKIKLPTDNLMKDKK